MFLKDVVVGNEVELGVSGSLWAVVSVTMAMSCSCVYVSVCDCLLGEGGL